MLQLKAVIESRIYVQICEEKRKKIKLKPLNLLAFHLFLHQILKHKYILKNYCFSIATNPFPKPNSSSSLSPPSQHLLTPSLDLLPRSSYLSLFLSDLNRKPQTYKVSKFRVDEGLAIHIFTLEGLHRNTPISSIICACKDWEVNVGWSGSLGEPNRCDALENTFLLCMIFNHGNFIDRNNHLPIDHSDLGKIAGFNQSDSVLK